MEGNSRPAVLTSDVARSLDHLVAASLVGQQEFARNLGLSLTDLVCFAHVAEAGDTPVTAGELAARAHVTTGAVTGILNRLERGGFVHRRPDPADRRRVHVVAVPAAAERVRAVFGPYHRLLADSLADHTPDEVALIAGWLDRAVALTRTYVEESC